MRLCVVLIALSLYCSYVLYLAVVNVCGFPRKETLPSNNSFTKTSSEKVARVSDQRNTVGVASILTFHGVYNWCMQKHLHPVYIYGLLFKILALSSFFAAVRVLKLR